MGQHLPDRLFWARDERDARAAGEHASDETDTGVTDGAELARRTDAPGTH
jgi:hypothetical protein